jgi:hypothetical protein
MSYPDESNGEAGTSAPAVKPWELMGRNTPGGKALYNLYGGNKIGKGRGAQYTQLNKERLEKQKAAGYTPAPLGK